MFLQTSHGCCSRLPCFASSFHLVGQRDIVGPDIKLPFAEAEHPAVHAAAVYAHTHVHVHSRHLSHQSAIMHARALKNALRSKWHGGHGGKWSREKHTRWPRSCPPPSPHSNERGRPSVPEVQTRSNNNPPGSWSADSGFPENTDITYRKHINSHYCRALEKKHNSRGLKIIFEQEVWVTLRGKSWGWLCHVLGGCQGLAHGCEVLRGCKDIPCDARVFFLFVCYGTAVFSRWLLGHWYAVSMVF